MKQYDMSLVSLMERAGIIKDLVVSLGGYEFFIQKNSPDDHDSDLDKVFRKLRGKNYILFYISRNDGYGNVYIPGLTAIGELLASLKKLKDEYVKLYSTEKEVPGGMSYHEHMEYDFTADVGTIKITTRVYDDIFMRYRTKKFGKLYFRIDDVPNLINGIEQLISESEKTYGERGKL